MKRVAVFGNAGGGKSTLSRQLAALTQLPHYPIDQIKYLPGGGEVPHEQYLMRHSEILAQEEWIIDGFGCAASTWERLARADTLVYIDLPLAVHALWVTKRFFRGLFVTPEGWPQSSPIFQGTLNSYRVLRLCHQKLTPRYRQYVTAARLSKTVYHLRSRRDIAGFVASVQ